jgi:methylmalonyl-CoA mutase cobalamin-binding domain/chain
VRACRARAGQTVRRYTPAALSEPADATKSDPQGAGGGRGGAKKIRVVVAKPGLDGHDRGAKIIARALRDAGMEVIYTGLHQTPEQIASTVIQEDADAVGLSILSGAHMTLVPRVVELLREQGVEDVVITVGGTIPSEDVPELKRLGVAEIFTPGASTQSIIDFIRTAVEGDRRPQEAKEAGD